MHSGRISFDDFSTAFNSIILAAIGFIEVGCAVQGISLRKVVEPNWCHLDSSF